MQKAPLSKTGATVRCSQLHSRGANAVVYGDAGHGVSPQMAQGCNSALESAAAFAKASSRAQSLWCSAVS